MPAIGAAIGAIVSSVGAAFAAGGFFTTFVGRLLLSVALSALQMALMDKPREPGIKTKVTQTGGTNPQAFPLLKYATAGTHACPPMTHGRVGETPNAFLTYVILLSDVPGCTLSRVMINNQYVTLGGTPHADYGLPVTGDMAGYAWVKFYDGSQTAADPMLLAKYALYPERPWLSDMIGRGTAYAIVTFRYKRDIFPNLPRVRFELNGIPLYDPRKDTTVGGAGAHRWGDRLTWESTENPMVATYNIMRGIILGDGSIYGGGMAAEDLPLAGIFTAMNECDLAVSNGAGTEAQFRAGLEVSVDEEPGDVIAELLKACSGQTAEVGGIWKFRTGPPGVPVMALIDADIVVSKDQNYRPFPNFASSYNGAHATYPDPETAWESKEAAPYYNATYEAEDQGQRLIADLNLVSVPYPAQVRRLMHAWVEEERRFRRHEATLPPDYVLLEPLDSVSWTSAANGYSAKIFEVAGVTEDVMTGLQRVILRERDSADFSYPSLPAPAPVSMLPVIPAAQTVPNFAVSGVSIPDATGADRRPALSLTWEPELADVTGILWEARIQATGVVVARGSTQDVASGALILAEGLIASTAYEVRAQPVVDRPATWTSWIPATTPATLITRPDLAEGSVSDQFQAVTLGPLLRQNTPNGTVLASINMGAIAPGTIWRRGVHFDMFLAVSSLADFDRVQLQHRYREFGSPTWSAWKILSGWGYVGTTGIWDQRTENGGTSGNYDEYEVRLVVVNNPGSGQSEWLRNIYLTLARVTK